MGGAVCNSFVETGSAEMGSGAAVVIGAVGSLVGFGDADDTGVGGASVTVGVETPVGDSGLLVEIADESDAGVTRLLVGAGVVDWATGSWFVDAALGVSTCWLHPHSNKPASALAAANRIFCNDFIFIIPFLKRVF